MSPGLQLKSIQVIRAEGISLKYVKKSYVTIHHGDKTYKSSWPHECPCDLDFSITSSNVIHDISFGLFRYRRIPGRQPLKLASASVEIRMIEEADQSKEITINMSPEEAGENQLALVIKVTQTTSLCPKNSTTAKADPDSSETLSQHVSLDPDDSVNQFEPPALNTSDSESNQVAQRDTSPGPNDSSIGPAVDTSESHPLGVLPESFQQQTERIGKVVQVIEPIKSIFDSIAEAHPIAKGVWFVVSGAYQVIEKQLDKDTRLVNLFNLMIKTYDTATQNDGLYKQAGDKNLSAVIDAMVKQSKDCSVFIANYGSRGYLARTANFSASEMIQKFSDDFIELEKAFATGRLDFAARTVQETKELAKAIYQGLSSVELGTKLNALEPDTRSPGAIAHCKYNTRQQSLLKITSWITGGNESVLWLHGVAGCGKSSLMGTTIEIIQQMGARSRLAAFIRFDRNAYNEAQGVVRELAYQLALFDSRLGEAIADAFQATNRILSPNLESQLKQLVLNPLEHCHERLEKDGPVAIIIDGLDECKDDDFFCEFLTFFSNNAFSSFPHIRVIIASRPEHRIHSRFRKAGDMLPHIHSFPLDISSDETVKDVQSYLEHELLAMDTLEPGFKSLCDQSNAAHELAKRASGLFIWAVVIIGFLQKDACSRLKTVLVKDPPANALKSLTQLYITVLNSLASPEKGEDEDIKRNIRLVLGFVKFSRYSFKDLEFLQNLLESYTDDDWSTQLPRLRDRLSCLIVDDDGDIQLIHKSLDDFLTDRNRCGDDWFLDRHEIEKCLASACSKILMSYLGDACMSNSVSIETIAIQYASLSFGFHYRVALQTGSQDNNVEIEAEISRFMQRYILRWVFYAVTISGIGNLAGGLIRLSENLDKTRDDPFASLIREAYRFSSALFGSYFAAEKENTILYFFHFLCAGYRKDMKILHQCYMPAFVQMAGGSRDYGDIIKAIKVLDDYPLLLSEDTLAEDIQIIGIPEEIDDKVLLRVDWDLKKSLNDYLR